MEKENDRSEQTKQPEILDGASGEAPSLTTMGKSLVKTAKDVLIGFFQSGEIIAEESLKNKRLKACINCSFCTENMRCNKCGCDIKRKVAVRYSSCPLRKWP